MDKKEVLEKAQSKRAVVGEMEKTKINKSSWIGNIVACVVAVALMVVEGAFGHFTSIYALASVCFVWASVFYFSRYLTERRHWGILLGAILEGVGAGVMITFFILYNVGVL